MVISPERSCGLIEKGLHTGNLAAAFAVIATTADLTLAGGAATLFGAALSGSALFKSSDRTTKKAAKDIAADLDRAIKDTHLTQDQILWVHQMVVCFPPTGQEFLDADMNGEKLTEILIKRIKDTASDGAHKTSAALDAYRHVMPTVFQEAIERDNNADVILKELLARTQRSGDDVRLRDEGITEKAIVRLAQRIAVDVDDVGQAWLELQNAMDIAVRVQSEGAVRSNHGDFVDEVLARVAAFAKEGEYAAAGAAIDSALAQAEAQVARLLHSGVEVALLERDTAKAAALLLRKADGDAGGRAAFETLRALQDHHYEIGRDKGSNLDSALAIDIAVLVVARAATPDERGAAGNDLGIALRTLGERESDTARLKLAEKAYTEALKEYTRDRVPLDWAMTQMNLGNALQTLGARESDTARLEQAVAAYTEALKEYTRDRVPLQWAMTQMNLGTALRILGERESDTARLKQAIAAYTEALKEYTRDRVPLDWAMTQGNLAGVEVAFFDKRPDQSHLDRAAGYVRAAREVYVDAQASHYIDIADRQLAQIDARRG